VGGRPAQEKERPRLQGQRRFHRGIHDIGLRGRIAGENLRRSVMLALGQVAVMDEDQPRIMLFA